MGNLDGGSQILESLRNIGGIEEAPKNLKQSNKWSKIPFLVSLEPNHGFLARFIEPDMNFQLWTKSKI